MRTAEPALYLDPLFPLWVREQPVMVPGVAGTATAVGMLVCRTGEYLLRPDGERARAIVASPAFHTIGSVSRAEAGRREHSIIARTDDARGVLLVVGQRLIDELAVAAFGEPGFCRFLDAIGRPGVVPCSSFASDLPRLVSALTDELAGRRPAYRVRARALLIDLLLVVYRSAITADVPVLSDGHHLATVIDWIEMNYADELRLDDLAAMMGTSPSHLSRVFRREVGTPLFEFINRVRIRKACGLLRRTDLPVTRIAVDVGYNNVSFFNRYFRRVMLVSPREYRRNAGR
jgi:AraC-like DNA-binding protein